MWVSGGFFDTFGIQPLAGRLITDADDRRNGGADGPVAVISDSFWQRHFGQAASPIGQRISLDRVSFTIVGMTAFHGAEVGRAFDVAVPIGCEPLLRGKETNLDRRTSQWLSVMIRRQPDQSFAALEQTLRGIQPQMRTATLPAGLPERDLALYLRAPLSLTPAATGASFLRLRYARPLWALLAIVLLVLVVACANVANLLLARTAARRHELSVRLALGASRARLARQLFVESLLLSGVGAGLGLLAARWAAQFLVQRLSTATNTLSLDLSLDWRVLGFTMLVAAATALLFGTAPAMHVTAADPIDALREQGRSAVGNARTGTVNALVVVQVALSVVLLVVAGLFVRTFTSLAAVNLGFDRDRILLASLDIRRTPPSERAARLEQIVTAVRALTGVANAALSSVTPVSGTTARNRIEVAGVTSLTDRQKQVNLNYVTSDWLATYGTPLLVGRQLEPRDAAGAPNVVIVNRAFERTLLNGASAIGRTITFNPRNRPGGARTLEVIGVAADAVYRSVREPMSPTMYLPMAQYDDSAVPLPTVHLSIRASAGAPAQLAHGVAAAVSRVDPDAALTFRSLGDQVDASLTQERVIATLVAFFGALAMLLAGLGLYGVTAYAVTRRRTEIGVRMALLVACGTAIGTGVSLWAAQLLTALLYGLQPRDPATLAGAAAILAVVGAVAGTVPAWRASRVDPGSVLREG